MKDQQTREQKLAAIRQKCLEANPDVAAGCYVHHPVLKTQPLSGPVPCDCTVRLADMLLAVQKKRRLDMSGNDQWEHEDARLIWGYWNLRADDLNQQSDETIDFIHSLLCV